VSRGEAGESGKGVWRGGWGNEIVNIKAYRDVGGGEKRGNKAR